MPCVGFCPYISISAESGGAKKAIAWYKDVFGANIKTVMTMENGKVGHAELLFGQSMLFIADAFPGSSSKTPADLGGCPVNFTVMMPGSSKQAYDKALANGATLRDEKSEYQTQPWGWKAGTVNDPFGFHWTIGEDEEKLSDAEIGEKLGMKEAKDEY
jgi:PhnB protein